MSRRSGVPPLEIRPAATSSPWPVSPSNALGEVSASSGLKAWLDAPPPGGVEEGAVEFTGWCFHPDAEIHALRLSANGEDVPLRFGLARSDVADAFPGTARAATSGFRGCAVLGPGEYRIRLVACVGTLGEATFEVPGSVTVSRRRPRRSVSGLSGALDRLGYLTSKAQLRLQQGRGWPSVWELVPLLRAASSDYVAERGTVRFRPPPVIDPYRAWLDVNRWTPAGERHLRWRLDSTQGLPFISIVTPVFRPNLSYFRETARSVRSQVYERWEWCLADDASGDRRLTRALKRLAGEEPRVRFVTRAENGHISVASNSAAALAHGEYLAFLDHDDLLSPDALGEVALYLAAHPDVDVLYSDDDKMSATGERFGPQFKPDWSPEALLCQMFMCHLLVIRRSLFAEVGGFRPGLEGSQDHDLALRATERARRVAHLPYVLYHWRAVPGSTALSGGAKPYSFNAGSKAVADALRRRGVRATTSRPEWAVAAGASIVTPQFPDEGPSVAILIATRNSAGMLGRCLDSIAKTVYRDYSVVILDDHSDDPDTMAVLASFAGTVLRTGESRSAFNYARLHNHAAERVSSEYLVFLNDDTEVHNPRWLSQLVGYGQLEGVGAVGARLVFPDGRVQHAGIVHGFNQGELALAFRGLSGDDAGYLAGAKATRNCGAVTAACMLTRRSLFLRTGGFDESAFPVSFNDVDYCYRLAELGYRIVYVGDAELVHHEGASRGEGSSPREVAVFRARYRGRTDPYFNPNLSTFDEKCVVTPRRLVRGPRPRIRAWFVTHALDLTGAPICQFEMVLGLHRRGVLEARVLSALDGPLRAEYEAAGLPVSLLSPELNHPESRRACDMHVRTLAERARADGADVVCASTLNTFYAIEAARRAELGSVWTVRESHPWQTYFDYLPRDVADLALGCFAHPYRIVFDSAACQGRFLALNSRHNFRVVHTGLPRQTFDPADRVRARAALGIRSPDVAVLLLGTVCERKGQHDLVRALTLVSPDVASVLRCFIVGDRPGEYSRQLAELVSQLPPELLGRVHVVAETRPVTIYWQAADLFVCTSRVESYPRVTLEAMDAALPIISTPVFGLAEQLRDGVNASFYEPGDVAALAAALTRLVRDPTLRLRMGQNSALVLDGLTSFDEMLDTYEQLLVEAAAAR